MEEGTNNNNSTSATTTIKINQLQAVCIKPLNQFLHTKLKCLESKLVDYEQDKVALQDLTVNYAGIIKKVELLEKKLSKLQNQFRIFSRRETKIRKKKDTKKKKQSLVEENIGPPIDNQILNLDFEQEEEIKSEPRSPKQENPDNNYTIENNSDEQFHEPWARAESEVDEEDQGSNFPKSDHEDGVSNNSSSSSSSSYFHCPNCSKKYKHKSDLQRHEIYSHYPELNPYRCTSCGLAFDRSNVLTKHMESKHPSSSSSSFTDNNNKTTVEKTTDPPAKPNRFPPFRRRRLVQRRGPSSYVCPYCRILRFPSKAQVQLHSFSCPSILNLTCTDPSCEGIGFADKEALLAHNQNQHRGKLYICSECRQSFSNTDAVNEHVNSVHKRIKPYLCPICGYSTPYRSSHDKHVQSHEGRRDYECGICKKSYTSNGV